MTSGARTLLGAALVVVGAALAACSDAGEVGVGSSEGSMTPLDRLLIGQAAEYPADLGMREALPELVASSAARRRAAWDVVRRVLEPVAVDGEGNAIPRFQTWFAREEVMPMFDRLLRGQSDDERRRRVPPAASAIDEAFVWAAERAPTLPDWSEERLARRRAEIEADGPASLGGPERVLMSPALVRHLYAHYDSVLGCVGAVPPADAPPPSESNFAPCVGEEFPPGAAVIKARWVPATMPLDAYDTSAEGLRATLEAGEWGAAPRTANPDPSSVYTMRLSNGLLMRLAALHVATKELRDWVWVTLFWSDTPDADLGADRPADLAAPFASYKMCSVVAYDDADDPLDTRDPAGLGAALSATRAFGPRSWCSNPFLEHGKGNATTNCIGCHQHGGTTHTSTTVLEGPDAFPDGSRGRHRSNFPADYLFVTGTGLELAAQMRAKVEQLAPPAPAAP